MASSSRLRVGAPARARAPSRGLSRNGDAGSTSGSPPRRARAGRRGVRQGRQARRRRVPAAAAARQLRVCREIDIDPAVDSIQIVGPYDAVRRKTARSAAGSSSAVRRLQPERGRCARAAHHHDAGAARLSSSRRPPATSQALLRFYDRPAESRRISRPASSGRSSGFWSRPTSCSASSAIRRPAPRRASVPAQRHRTRLAAVVLPLEQHSRRRAARAAPAGQLQDPQVARAAGAPDAREIARRGAGRELRRSVALSAQPADPCAGPVSFPDSTTTCARRFRRETELFLDSQLRDDRSVDRSADANYTFVNERLARHYGIPNVYGSHFRRVTLARRPPGRTARPGQHA